MHLRVLVNGNFEKVQKWKHDLSAQALLYEYEKGKPKGALQLTVRTMEIVDICFPEEHLDTVLKIVKPTKNTYGVAGTKKSRYPWLDRAVKLMIKTMKLKPIPEYEKKPHYLDKTDVAVHGIGIKKDLYDDDGIELI